MDVDDDDDQYGYEDDEAAMAPDGRGKGAKYIDFN